MKKIKSLINKRVILGIVVLLVIGLILRALTSSKPEKFQETQIKKGEVNEELTLSGKIDAHEHVNLQFQTGGLLSWVGVAEGDKVNKYQAIASLDTRQLKKTLDKKLNDYLKTRWTYDQTTKDDYKDKVITDSIKRILDKAGFDLSNSVIDVELQDLAIQLATVTTPISGIVTRVDTPYPGINIAATQIPFEIVNPETLYFSVTADQTEVIKIHEGDKTVITLDAYPEETIGATVESISYSPKQGETATVYEIKVAFTNPDDLQKFRLGMTGDANFITSKKENVFYVPPQFIKNDNKGKYLLVGPKKTKVYITSGIEGEDRTEVEGPVNENETIYD